MERLRWDSQKGIVHFFTDGIANLSNAPHADDYISAGVPADIAAFLAQVPFNYDGKYLELDMNQSMSVVQMKDALNRGVNRAPWRPAEVLLKDCIIRNTTTTAVDLTVVHD